MSNTWATYLEDRDNSLKGLLILDNVSGLFLLTKAFSAFRWACVPLASW